MASLNAKDARIPTAAFNDVLFKGSRIRVNRRDGVAVVIVSEEDAALLEALEDRFDLETVRKTLADMKARGEKPVPWEEAKAHLGL